MIRSIVFVFIVLVSGRAAAIPVADVSTVAQTIADAALQVAQQAFLKELDERLAAEGIKVDENLAKEARDQFKDYYEERRDIDGYGWSVPVGNTDYYASDEVKDQGHVYISDDVGSEVNTELSNNAIDDAYREHHKLKSDVPFIQESHDRELQYRKMLDKSHAENNRRMELIDALRARANTAETPNEKADIANVIEAEQVSLMNENLRMQTIMEMKEQDARLERYRLNKAAYEALTNPAP